MFFFLLNIVTKKKTYSQEIPYWWLLLEVKRLLGNLLSLIKNTRTRK